MGFATSVTVVIIFIGIITIASTTIPMMRQSQENLQESKEIEHEMKIDKLNTAIEIVEILDGGNNLYICVSNTGTTTLCGNKSNVLIDGIYKNYTVTPTGYWVPQTDAIFVVNINTSVNHIIKVISENGISDIESFYRQEG